MLEAKAKPEFKARMTVRLAVAGAFHTEYMNSAVETLSEVLAKTDVLAPRIPVYSNVDAKSRFANGTQGRLLCWQPESVEKGKVLLANHPYLSARFVKESAHQS